MMRHLPVHLSKQTRFSQSRWQHKINNYVKMRISKFVHTFSKKINRLMTFKSSLFLLFFFLLSGVAMSQDQGYLELVGQVQQDGKGLEGAEIKVLKGIENADNLLTSAGGKFIFNLDLGHVYTIIFLKNGSITKSVLVDTKVPEQYQKQIFSFKFKIDLFKAPEGQEPPKEAAPPVTKLAYSDVYEDFDYDPEYSKARKTEMEQVKQKMAVEVAKQEAAKKAAMDKARTDSLLAAKKIAVELEKARQDSLNKVKEQQRVEALARAAAEKAAADSVAKVQEKQRLEAAAIAVKEKARQDSLVAIEKAKLAAEAAEKARLKAYNDSIARVEAKIKLDSVNSAKERERLEALARDKAKQDSINTAREQAKVAELARAAREKAIADSMAVVKEKARLEEMARAAREKAVQDSIARVNEKLKADSLAAAKEKQRQEALAREQAKQDSIATAKEQARLAEIARIAREKAAADSIAQAKEQARIAEIARQAREKVVADSLAAVKEKELLAAREKARQEEIAKQAREKAVRDSLAEVRSKFVQDSIASAKAAALKLEQEREARIQAQKDSLENAKRVQEEEALRLAAEMKKKQEEDAERKRMDEIEAQKKALAGTGGGTAPKKPASDISAYKFDFDKQFIAEGITQDTIVENNRTILRSIVKSTAVQATYLRVTYSYGGVFFFKNSQSITENSYNMELDAIRKTLKK
jgi:hypothetical protein